MRKIDFVILFICFVSFLFGVDYGSMYITNGSTSQTTSATAGTWQQITGYSEMVSSGLTVNSSSISTSGSAVEKTYLIRYSLSFYAGAALWSVGVSIGGNTPEGRINRRISSDNTDVGNISGSFLATITASTSVMLKASCDAASKSFTPVHSQLVVTEICESELPQYAEMNIFNNSVAQSGITSFTTITGFSSTDADMEGWTYSNNVLTASAGSGGTYLAIFSVSFSGNIAAPEIGISLNNGDPLSTNIIIKRTIGDADIGNAGACGILNISEGNTIRLKAKSNANITVAYCNLALLKLAGVEPPYGSIYIVNNSNETALAINTWHKETNLIQDEINTDYWNFDTFSDILTPSGLSAGKYMVNYHTSLRVPLGSGSSFTFDTKLAVFNKNDPIRDLTTLRTMERKQSSGNNPDVASITGVGIITIQNLDDALSFQLLQNTISSVSVIEAYANINLFRIETINDGSLPVELSYFAGTIENGVPTLSWITQSEQENLGWNVYRSQNENGFANNNLLQLNEALIPGMGTTSQPTHYSFIDEYPIQINTTYFYWLESVSLSQELGQYGPTALFMSDHSAELPVRSELQLNYPNPFNPTTTIEFEIEAGENGTLTIYNLKGQKVYAREYESGYHSFNWDGSDYASGIYFYRLQTPSYYNLKKMLMLK